MWQNEGGMISAAGVRYAVGKLTASRFHRCMGRVPSDEKTPDDTSAEGKCTVCLVRGTYHSLLSTGGCMKIDPFGLSAEPVGTVPLVLFDCTIHSLNTG